MGGLFSLLTLMGSRVSPFESLREWVWAPYHFPDCVGFISLAFFMYFLCLKNEDHKNTGVSILGGLLAVLTFAYCENKSLWYGFGLAVGAVAGLKILTRFKMPFYGGKNFMGLSSLSCPF